MATLLETASLVMVPSGYEDGALGSLVPTDASGDFAFTRGSNLSATRVNEQGYIERGYENLLLQSNNFDTSPWTKVGLFNVLGNQQGYDSSNDAWSIESNSTAFDRRIQQSVSVSGVHTFAIYAKSNSTDWVLLYNGTDRVYFDLANGVVGSSKSGLIIDSKIESTPVTGWYKCTATFNRAISFISVVPASGDGNSMVVAGNSIYIQDAQLNQGLVAYPYIETTAAPEKGGILADLPRVDYSSGRASLLLEPQRTNLVRYSESYGDGWSQQQGSSTNGGVGLLPISPTSGSIKYTATAEGYNQMFTTIQPPTTIGVTYTQQGYVKCDDAPYIHFQVAPFNNVLVVWDNVNKVIVGSIPSGLGSVKIVDAGGGWTKAEITYTAQFESIYASIKTYFSTSSTINHAGVPIGTIAYQTLVQVEEGSYSTSYIPTYGTSQTRLRDSASKTGISNLIGQTEGAVFLEVGEVHNNSATGPTKWFFRVIKDANNSFGIGSGGIDSNPPIRFVTIVGGVITTEHEAAGFSNSKIVIKYTSTDFKLFQNGVLKNITSKSIGGYADIAFMEGASDNLSMPLKQHIVFPTALSDEACIELTTL